MGEWPESFLPKLKSEYRQNYLLRLGRFKKAFSAYVPHLCDEDLAFEMEWLWFGFLHNSPATVRRTQAKADLQKLAKALRVLIEHQMPYWEPLSSYMRDVGHSDDPILQWADEIYDFLMKLSEVRDEGWTEEVLGRFVAAANQAIDGLPETANINWNAVDAVARLRGLWWRNTDQQAPRRALNPASTFASFLRDGFTFLELSADPISAFRRWAATTPASEK